MGSVTGHAHPYPPTESVLDGDYKLRRLHASLAKDVHLEVVLVVPSDDPIIPRVRRTPPSGESVQHLDLVSCWKGLSYQQARELDIWEQSFEASIT